jgi:non-specific serine/threonine protein kinase
LGRVPTLLVLDNCEQVVDAAADLVHRVLVSGPGTRVLATSREALRVAGEAVVAIPPLNENDAVELFQSRARLVQPEAGRIERTHAAAICARLDRLPLGIELAAAWTDVLPPQELLARLESALSLPPRLPRAATTRHRGLRATMDWSHELLDAREQRLLRRLSVFAGGFSLDAAGAVCGEPESGDGSVLPVLARLVDKSLVVAGSASRGEARYRLLETVREYIAEKLTASGEAERVRRLHFAHFVAMAASAGRELHGPRQAEWLDRLDQEHDNIGAALDWGLSNEPALGLEAASALGWFWNLRGHYREGRARIEALLAAAPDADPAVRAEAQVAAARLAHNQGDSAAHRRLIEESLIAWRRLGDDAGTARALISLGILRIQDPPAEAAPEAGPAPVFGEALELARRAGETHALSNSLMWLGRMASWRGESTEAKRLMEESLEIAHSAGDLWMVAFVNDHLGHITLASGESAAAHAYHEQALEMYRQLGEPWGIAHQLAYLAASALALSRHEQAAAYARQCLDVRGVVVREPVAVEVMAAVAAAGGDFQRALRLHGAASAMPYLGPRMTTDLEGQRWFAAARRALGEKHATAAWEAGRRLSPDDAVRAALAIPSARPGGLSPRELEIAVLLGRGLRNREIAERLFLGVRTVDAHVEHIRNKLGCRSRAEIAAWAASQGVLDEARD